MRLAILSIIIFSSVYVRGQSLEQTYHLGKKLYANGNLESAEEVFRRVLFFDKNEKYSSEVNLKFANILYQSGKYDEANYYYDLAYFTADESAKIDITLQKASCYLLLQNYGYARIELYNLPQELSSNQKKLAIFFTAMLEFAEANYDDSKESFMSIASDTVLISSLFEKNQKINKLKPKTAKVLSIILPGLGQVYAGDWKAGINSLVLTGGLFYLGINSAIQNSFLDAAIGVLPWFQRYYSGGFKRAEKIAEAKILERRHAVFNEILQAVEEQGK